MVNSMFNTELSTFIAMEPTAVALHKLDDHQWWRSDFDYTENWFEIGN